MGAAAKPESAFRSRTILLIIAVGILAFVAMLVLGAYAPQLRSGRNGGAHALSDAATGYSGIVQLARATGRNPQIVRNQRLLATEDLVVLTPEPGAADLAKLLRMRSTQPTLVVLPKWQTVADPTRRGWVRAAGTLPARVTARMLAPDHRLWVERHGGGVRPLRTVLDYAPEELRFTVRGLVQTVGGPGLRLIVADAEGRGVLVRVGERPLYVLADPDLLSNHGISERRRAAAALALLDFLNATGASSIVFDVTLNGLGNTRSPLRLIFDPPFLAVTLALAAALLLAGVQAAARFGPARRPVRAIAFGKAALIDNAAALVRQARREAALGGRYAEMIRDRAVTAFGVPARLRDGAVDDYLDKLDGRGRFSALAAAAKEARGREELLAAAQALHQWQWEKKA